MYLVFLVFLICIIASFAYAGRQSGAPFVPSRASDVERFLTLAKIQKGETMIDVGCGDGRMVCAAATHGARAIGYELAFIPWCIANMRALLTGTKKHVQIKMKNFWHVSWRDADVIYVFLVPKAYVRLKEKLEKEMKPGAHVITYVWPIDGWTPIEVSEKKGRPNMFLYRYEGREKKTL